MKKYLRLIMLLSMTFLLRVSCVEAYDLTLTNIGSVSTLGTDYSLTSYTGGVPTFVGTASPSAQVSVKIKTLLSSVVASTSGVWQFVPSSLDQGDSLIVISSGTQSITFTLRFNATASATLSAVPTSLPDESTLPSVGVWQYYILAVGIGFGVFFLGRYGRKRMQKWENGD
jgi:hypothetical protein